MSAFGSLHDVLHSTAFTVARNVTLFFVVLFWLGFAYWTFRDARRRIDDPWLVGTATLLGLVPFIGPLVYLLFRPPETLAEVRTREVELRALESPDQPAAAAVPGLPQRRRAGVPHLPRLHDPPEGAVRALRGAARAALAGLPVLPDTRERPDDGGDLDAALVAEAAVAANGNGTPQVRRSRRACPS